MWAGLETRTEMRTGTEPLFSGSRTQNLKEPEPLFSFIPGIPEIRNFFFAKKNTGKIGNLLLGNRTKPKPGTLNLKNNGFQLWYLYISVSERNNIGILPPFFGEILMAFSLKCKWHNKKSTGPLLFSSLLFIKNLQNSTHFFRVSALSSATAP